MAKTILIADDEADVRELVADVLETSGYKVLQAVNGKDALEKITQAKPDLVILDIRMPEMTGFEVCRKAKSTPALRHIPIIYITASSQKITEQVMADTMANGHVFKPFEIQTILDLIKRFMG